MYLQYALSILRGMYSCKTMISWEMAQETKDIGALDYFRPFDDLQSCFSFSTVQENGKIAYFMVRKPYEIAFGELQEAKAILLIVTKVQHNASKCNYDHHLTWVASLKKINSVLPSMGIKIIYYSTGKEPATILSDSNLILFKYRQSNSHAKFQPIWIRIGVSIDEIVLKNIGSNNCPNDGSFYFVHTDANSNPNHVILGFFES